MNDDLFETGLEIRREVLGREYVDASMANVDEFSEDFQRLLTEYCWGAAWGRSALTRRDRSLLNLVMLGVLNRSAEFKLHLRGAINNGCTREEIKDALIQLMVYAGVPAGVEAFRNARQVLAEIDADQPG
jgi:4-carboxymuconolactone decarboxylase